MGQTNILWILVKIGVGMVVKFSSILFNTFKNDMNKFHSLLVQFCSSHIPFKSNVVFWTCFNKWKILLSSFFKKFDCMTLNPWYFLKYHFLWQTGSFSDIFIKFWSIFFIDPFSPTVNFNVYRNFKIWKKMDLLLWKTGLVVRKTWRMPYSATEIKCRNMFSHLKDTSLSEGSSLEVISEGYMWKNLRKELFFLIHWSG